LDFLNPLKGVKHAAAGIVKGPGAAGKRVRSICGCRGRVSYQFRAWVKLPKEASGGGIGLDD